MAYAQHVEKAKEWGDYADYAKEASHMVARTWEWGRLIEGLDG